MREKIKIIAWVSLALFWSLAFGQDQAHYYNLDTEKTIKGAIQEIKMEPRYKDSSPFLIVILEEKDTGQIYTVEISPVRFFFQDFHKGENLEVVGSLYSKEDGSLNIIARQIRFQGEIITLRDKLGFPAWRGGEMKQKGKRRGKRF